MTTLATCLPTLRLIVTTLALPMLVACGSPPAAPPPAAEAEADPMLPCTYASEGEFAEHETCAGYTESGELTLAPEHLQAATADQEQADVLVNGQWHYVRADGRSLAVVTYDNGPDYFSEGLVRARRDGKIGYYDERLEPVVAPRYDWGWPFEGGLALVCSGCEEYRPPGDEHTQRVGGSWAVIDTQGNEVIGFSEDRESVAARLETLKNTKGP